MARYLLKHVTTGQEWVTDDQNEALHMRNTQGFEIVDVVTEDKPAPEAKGASAPETKERRAPENKGA